MASGLTRNEKIALGVGGAAVVSLIGLHLYNQSRFSQIVTNDGLTIKQTGATTLDITYTNTTPAGNPLVVNQQATPFFQIWIFGPGLGNGVLWQTTQAYSSTPVPPQVGTGNVSSDGNTVTWTGVNLTSLGGQNGTYTIKGEKGAWIVGEAIGGGTNVGMADLGNTEANITINTLGKLSWWQKI